MTSVCINEKVTEEDARQIRELTDSFGRTEFIPERLMAAAGAVSGSSPAYVFMFIEAMADAAVAQECPGNRLTPLRPRRFWEARRWCWRRECIRAN